MEAYPQGGEGGGRSDDAAALAQWLSDRRATVATGSHETFPRKATSAAYVLMHALRRIGLAGTVLQNACADTIRLRLLKIGARITVSIRRVKFALSEACPNQREFIAAFHALSAAAA